MIESGGWCWGQGAPWGLIKMLLSATCPPLRAPEVETPGTFSRPFSVEGGSCLHSTPSPPPPGLRSRLSLFSPPATAMPTTDGCSRDGAILIKLDDLSRACKAMSAFCLSHDGGSVWSSCPSWRGWENALPEYRLYAAHPELCLRPPTPSSGQRGWGF